MSHATLARLKRQLKVRGITQEQVAAEANVGRTLVVHVLAGRAKSRNVVDTVKRLIAEFDAPPPQSSADRLAALIADPGIGRAEDDARHAAAFGAARRK